MAAALGPTLQTERLILRPPTLDDVEPWAEMMADPKTSWFIGGVQPYQMVWRSIAAMAGCWALTGVSMFSVLEKASGRWVGRIGPWSPGDWPGTEVGWGLHPAAHGRGYAVEAASACMDYAVDVLGWDEIIHCIDAGNVASQRVAERLGSRRLRPAVMPAPFAKDPLDLWGQSASEWRARRRG